MIKGSIVALITPFKENGEIDYEALKNLVEWHVAAGTDAIACCGTTGEDPTLSDAERREVLKVVLETVQKRVPVIMGTGTNNTRTSVANMHEAKEMGAECALVIMPYYNRPTYEGCLAHFEELSRVGFPYIIYYNPIRTGVRLTAEQLGALADLPNVVAIKDASGSVDFTEQLKTLTQVPIFSGDDVIAFEQLKKGAAGVISIVANVVPSEWKEMVHHALAAQYEKSAEIYERLIPLCQSLVIETNPQGVKYAAHLLGKCEPYLRLPLVQPRSTTKSAIESAFAAEKLR